MGEGRMEGKVEGMGEESRGEVVGKVKERGGRL